MDICLLRNLYSFGKTNAFRGAKLGNLPKGMIILVRLGRGLWPLLGDVLIMGFHLGS